MNKGIQIVSVWGILCLSALCCSGCSTSSTKIKNNVSSARLADCIGLVRDGKMVSQVQVDNCIATDPSGLSVEAIDIKDRINKAALSDNAPEGKTHKVMPHKRSAYYKIDAPQPVRPIPAKTIRLPTLSDQPKHKVQNVALVSKSKGQSRPLPKAVLPSVYSSANELLIPVRYSAEQRHAARYASSHIKKAIYQPQRAAVLTSSRRNKKGWADLVQGYSLSPALNKKLVKAFIKYYAEKSSHVSRLSNRAAVFLPLVIEEVKNRNMPMEIALLPFVESGYSATALSPASAAGLWQFIPATANRYGLTQSEQYDDRLNPDASTTAALDYLQDLHQKFGDWLLALAAYNAGERRVENAIKAQRKKGLATDYWSLALPKETRLYIPRLLAYRELIRRPDLYGIELPTETKLIQLRRLRINQAIDLKMLSDIAQLPGKNMLQRLNPNFLNGKTNPQYEKNILIPSLYYDQVKLSLAKSI